MVGTPTAVHVGEVAACPSDRRGAEPHDHQSTKLDAELELYSVRRKPWMSVE
jgi:hypothetical protein